MNSFISKRARKTTFRRRLIKVPKPKKGDRCTLEQMLPDQSIEARTEYVHNGKEWVRKIHIGAMKIQLSKIITDAEMLEIEGSGWMDVKHLEKS